MKKKSNITKLPVGTLFQFDDGIVGMVLEYWEDGGLLYWNIKFGWKNIYYQNDYCGIKKILYSPLRKA